MVYEKITAEQLAGKGLQGLPDTPQLSCEEMQGKFEEIVRDVIIPSYNSLVDRLNEREGNTYTKDQVNSAISAKVVEIGSGDMAKGVYDSDNSGIVDNSERLGGEKPDYYATSADHTSLRAAVSGLKTDVQNITTDIKYIRYVTALPLDPDENTLYLVKK